MSESGGIEPYQIAIKTALDIVTLRQSVRQTARSLGFDLPLQAKVTVVISTIAQAMLDDQTPPVFTIQVQMQASCQALEIVCVSPDRHKVGSIARLKQRLQIHEVWHLVDGVAASFTNDTIRLSMRLWLHSQNGQEPAQSFQALQPLKN
jgi:hypothetical protein